MIIRVLGKGQYLVNSSLFDRLNKIDNDIVEHVKNGDEKGFRAGLAELIGVIVKEGKPVDPKTIVESDIIVPPDDLTLSEARDVFRHTGIFEG